MLGVPRIHTTNNDYDAINIRGGYLGSCYRHTSRQTIIDDSGSKQGTHHYTISKQLAAHKTFYQRTKICRFGHNLDCNTDINHDESNIKTAMSVKTEAATVLIDNQNVWFQNETFPCIDCCSTYTT